MEPLSDLEIESACEILDRRREESPGGLSDLPSIVAALTAHLGGRITPTSLTAEYRRWKRAERMSREYGSVEDEHGGDMDSVPVEDQMDEGSVVSMVIGRLIDYIGEERLTQARLVTTRSMRRLRPGQTARGARGPGSEMGIAWLTCAVIIESTSGAEAVLPECRFHCLIRHRFGPAVSFFRQRLDIDAAESTAKRVMSKLTAIRALYSHSRSASDFAAAIGVTRANISHHARKFAEKALEADPRARLSGVRMG